jgi:hypothetical protein
MRRYTYVQELVVLLYVLRNPDASKSKAGRVNLRVAPHMHMHMQDIMTMVK